MEVLAFGDCGCDSDYLGDVMSYNPLFWAGVLFGFVLVFVFRGVDLMGALFAPLFRVDLVEVMFGPLFRGVDFTLDRFYYG